MDSNAVGEKAIGILHRGSDVTGDRMYLCRNRMCICDVVPLLEYKTAYNKVFLEWDGKSVCRRYL